MKSSNIKTQKHVRFLIIFVFILCNIMVLNGCKKITTFNGNYTISSVESGQLLAVKIEDVADEYQLTFADEGVNSVWHLEKDEEDNYVFVSVETGLALTVGTLSSQNSIYLEELGDGDAQRFTVTQAYPNSGEKYKIYNPGRGKGRAFSTTVSSDEYGVNIELQSYRFRTDQQWIITKYDSGLLARELITATEAWNVFDEAGQGYVGEEYQQDFSKNNIHPASTIDPRLVSPGTMIPGRVIVDGKPFVEYYPGTLPYIAVCIHNKVKVTKQMRENYPMGWKACRGDCDPVKASIEFRDGLRSIPEGDAASGQLCQRTVKYLEEITGKRPHMIVPKWPKGLMDMNRSPRDTVVHTLPPLRQHPDILATWDDFRSFVREARDVVYQEWGGGLQIGFHGQISRGARNHIGTGIIAKVVDKSKGVLEDPASNSYKKIMQSSSLKYSLHQRKISPWEAYKGQYSLGQGVAIRGIPTFPSATMRDQEGKFWSTGGAFERSSVSKTLQDKKIEGRPFPYHHPNHFDSVQLESYTFFMQGKRLDAYAAQLGEAIYDNLVHNLGFDIPRVKRTEKAMTFEELSASSALPASDCKGDPIASTEEGKVDKHFHLPQSCLAFCRDTAGCKYVSMFVTPSPVPKSKDYHKTRKCFAYNSCDVVEKSDFNLYQL